MSLTPAPAPTPPASDGADRPPEAATLSRQPEPRSYGQIVWQQFNRNLPARLCFWLLVLAFHLAVFAPLIANRFPFWWELGRDDPKNPVSSFPAIFHLLDRNAWKQNNVDIAFNLLLVAYMPALLALLLIRFTLRRRARRVALAAFLGALVVAVGVGVAYLDIERPFTDYRAAVESEESVRMLRAMFPTARAATVASVAETLCDTAGPRDTHDVLRAAFDRKLTAADFARYQASIDAVIGPDVNPDAAALFAGLLARSPFPAARERVTPVRALWAPVRYSPFDDSSADKEMRDGPAARARGHYLGTDQMGMDVLARLLYGTRVSLTIGVVAVSIFVTLGVLVGGAAGYFRGWVDMIISRFIEIVICFPSFFMIITAVAFLGPSIFNIMLVIGVFGWTGTARLVRGEFLKLGAGDFVVAARALGLSAPRIMFRHVLPNALAPVLVTATFGVAGAILSESSLSFLGFGPQPPVPTWGYMLNTGRNNPNTLSHLIFWPGFCIFLVVTLFNLMGEGLRDAIDPKLRQ
ncbi:MAG: ABC transporter permease [Planctomycetes bacterium]|nr:ABC transporter permease [Planctomycetota bacterium]